MKALMIAAAVAAQGQAAAPAGADPALGLIRDEIVAVRPYVPGGLDLKRGRVMHTRPQQNVYGDCRSQRLTLFSRRYAPNDPRAHDPERLGELELTNRFRRPDWTASREPRDCGDPLAGAWTIAKGDQDFYRAADILGRLSTEVQRSGRLSPGFRLTCTDSGHPCSNPEARLKEALALGVGEVVWEGNLLVAAHRPYYEGAWEMRITDGGISSVELKFHPPAVS